MKQRAFLQTLADIGRAEVGDPDRIRQAWAYWASLDESQRDYFQAQLTGPARERFRLWRKAFDGGMETVLDHVEALEAQLEEIRATVLPTVVDAVQEAIT